MRLEISSFSKFLNKSDLSLFLNVFFGNFLNSSGISFHSPAPNRDKDLLCIFVRGYCVHGVTICARDQSLFSAGMMVVVTKGLLN